MRNSEQLEAKEFPKVAKKAAAKTTTKKKVGPKEEEEEILATPVKDDNIAGTVKTEKFTLRSLRRRSITHAASASASVIAKMVDCVKAHKSSKEADNPSISIGHLRTCIKARIKPSIRICNIIVEAIGALKQIAGSTRQAIVKFLEHKYEMPGKFKDSLSKQLRRLTGEGKIVQVRRSFKLAVKNSELKANESAKEAKNSEEEIMVTPVKEYYSATTVNKEKSNMGSLRRRSGPFAVDAQVYSSTHATCASAGAPVKGSIPAAAKRFKGSTSAASSRKSLRFEALEKEKLKNKNKKKGGKK